MIREIRSWVWLPILLLGTLESRAQLKAAPAKVDLGQRKQEQIVSAEVRLTNAGTAPLEIISTTADCSCTVAKPTKTNLVAGESTTLQVSVNTQTYQGALHRIVRVETTTGELVIPVDLTVIPYEHWKLAPSTLVMPPSQKSSGSVAHVTLNYTGAEKAVLGPITCAPDYLEISSTGDGRNFDLTFRKLPDTPVGNFTIKVVMKTNDAADPQLKLNVFLSNAGDSGTSAIAAENSPQTQEPLRIIPATIVLPTVRVGQNSTREITLQGWPKKLEPRVTISRGQVKLLSRQANELRYEISLSPAMAGPFAGVLSVFDGERLMLQSAVMLQVESPAKGK